MHKNDVAIKRQHVPIVSLVQCAVIKSVDGSLRNWIKQKIYFKSSQRVIRVAIVMPLVTCKGEIRSLISYSIVSIIFLFAPRHLTWSRVKECQFTIPNASRQSVEQFFNQRNNERDDESLALILGFFQRWYKDLDFKFALCKAAKVNFCCFKRVRLLFCCSITQHRRCFLLTKWIFYLYEYLICFFVLFLYAKLNFADDGFNGFDLHALLMYLKKSKTSVFWCHYIFLWLDYAIEKITCVLLIPRVLFVSTFCKSDSKKKYNTMFV